jgi:hypothetical protein
MIVHTCIQVRKPIWKFNNPECGKTPKNFKNKVPGIYVNLLGTGTSTGTLLENVSHAPALVAGLRSRIRAILQI